MGEVEKSPRRTITDTALKEDQTWNKVKNIARDQSKNGTVDASGRSHRNKDRNGLL